jgi:ferrous iron transport protein A
MGDPPAVSLAELPTGAHVLVRDLCGGRELAARLAAMGLVTGAHLEVLQNHGRGPLLVLVRDTRIVLGRGVASKVLVEVSR